MFSTRKLSLWVLGELNRFFFFKIRTLIGDKFELQYICIANVMKMLSIGGTCNDKQHLAKRLVCSWQKKLRDLRHLVTSCRCFRAMESSASFMYAKNHTCTAWFHLMMDDHNHHSRHHMFFKDVLSGGQNLSDITCN